MISLAALSSPCGGLVARESARSVVWMSPRRIRRQWLVKAKSDGWRSKVMTSGLFRMKSDLITSSDHASALQHRGAHTLGVPPVIAPKTHTHGNHGARATGRTNFRADTRSITRPQRGNKISWRYPKAIQTESMSRYSPLINPQQPAGQLAYRTPGLSHVFPLPGRVK